MPTINDHQFTLPAAAAIGAHVRVTINASGEAAIAGASDRGAGITQNEALAAGDLVTIRPLTSGVHIVTAGGAVAVGVKIAPAADGKYTQTGAVPYDMIALEAASGDGSRIKAVFVGEDA